MRAIKRWYQLSNRYWLKINLFRLIPGCWTEFGRDKEYRLDIAVGKTRRAVNDHYSKTRHSPKSMYLKSTNHGGIEAFMRTLDFIEECQYKLPKGSVITVQGSDDKRTRVYRRLLRYGFIEAAWFDPGRSWNGKEYYFKEI